MKASDVLQIIDQLHSADVGVFVAGGWGVDALIGTQSRLHDDLDLAFDAADEDRVLLVLSREGFRMTTDERPVRFVLQDQCGRQVDFHPVAFDAGGNGEQRGHGGVMYHYPSNGFARGLISGQVVDCLSAELLIQFHLGYEPTDKDIRDMELLRAHLGLS